MMLKTSGTVEERGSACYTLSIPGGDARMYRLAQVDDYRGLPRARFPWQAPCIFEVNARVSAPGLPGTWGFGFWNDPFSFNLRLQGAGQRLPALPNAAWFFHASPENYLSFRNDRPASGFLAAVFSSPPIPAGLLAPGLAAAPFLALPLTARLLRRLLSQIVRYDAALLELDPGLWHSYRIEIKPGSTCFLVDGDLLFETGLSPRGRLGMVTWIDNQYAGFTPGGQVQSGTQANPPAWMEIEGLKVR